MMETTERIRRPSYPRCGSGPVARIVYGLPLVDTGSGKPRNLPLMGPPDLTLQTRGVTWAGGGGGHRRAITRTDSTNEESLAGIVHQDRQPLNGQQPRGTRVRTLFTVRTPIGVI